MNIKVINKLFLTNNLKRITTMKTRIILSLVLALSIAALGFTSVPSDTTKTVKQKKATAIKSKAKTVYVCPMDKDVVSSKPGKCPKCGMDLQKTTLLKTEKKPLPIEKESVSYSCPMDKDVVSSKPGKCPKCGMDLQKKTTLKIEKKSLPTEKDTVSYSCPMDKDVISSKPGKCPKCGMNLEKAAPTEKID
jgi:hypothetical protein